MEPKIFKIDCIEIENANFKLKIQEYKKNPEELSKKSCLSIKSHDKSIDRKWILKNKETVKVKNHYDYNERTGIWFEKEPDLQSIFTKVSLFEETKYSFKFESEIPSSVEEDKEDYNNKRNENFRFQEYLKRFFEVPQKWISKSGYVNDNEEERDQYKINKNFEGNNTWILNFRSYTGRLKLKKTIIKKDINDIEILPRKLTKENYIFILNKLTHFVSQIFFQFKSPSEISASRDYIQSKNEKDRLYIFPKVILIEMIMKELPSYFYGLINHLNTKFVYLREKIENYELSDPTTIDYVETISHAGNLLFLSDVILKKSVFNININKQKYALKNLIINSQNLSYDTQENRFIKFVLKLLLFELNNKDIENILNEIGKEKAKKEYKSYLTEKIKFLETEGVNDLHRIPYNSQLLQKNNYYRRFLQYFMWLQYPTIFNIDKLFTIDLKPMHLLYEYFCLYVMKEALDRIAEKKELLKPFSGNPEDCYEVIDADGKEPLKFREIKYITLKYRNLNDEEIQLIYKTEGLNPLTIKREIDNKDFRVPYSRFRSDYIKYIGKEKQIRKKPDYALLKINNMEVCEDEDGRNSMVILDAKYRPDTPELWDKMHLYKDSLMAIGCIFINPFTSIKDIKYSKKLITIYGELFTDNLVTHKGKKIGKDQDLYQKAKSSGFISGINLLGLKKSKNDYMKSAINDFQKLFEKVLQIYFQKKK